MYNFLTALLVLLVSFCSWSYPLNPDPQVTYGELCNPNDHDYEGPRYEESIPYCRRNVSSWTKQKIYELYNISEECRHRYTIDHFIPLALGGSNAESNLWPEHKLVKATRPTLEQELYEALDKAQMSQAEALKIIIKAKTEDINQMRIDKNFNSSDSCDDPWN